VEIPFQDQRFTSAVQRENTVVTTGGEWLQAKIRLAPLQRGKQRGNRWF
jgi:hypothetical protein